MGEETWFREEDALVEELRSAHRDEERPRVPGYSDLAELSSGGQGTVYSATRDADGHPVALKVLHRRAFRSPLEQRRYEREISLVARLQHPNLVRLYRYGRTDEGRAFLCMELVEGTAFDRATAGRSVEEVLELVRQVASALEHAHRRGVIHRDLKPSNVLVDESGNVRVLDFGLAKPARRIREDGWELSATGQFLGTLAWASPEQVRGDPRDIDVRTDIYSLGVLMYSALAGCMPYSVEGSVAELVEAVEHVAPTPLHTHRAEARGDVETVALRCLAKDANRRYASMSELVRDLECCLAGQPVEARRDSAAYLLRTLVARNKLAAGVLAVAVVGLSAATFFAVRANSSARDSEAAMRAALEAKRAEVDKVAAVNEYLIGSFLGPRNAARSDLRVAEALDTAVAGLGDDPSLADRPGVRADLHMAYAYWFSALPDRLGEAETQATIALELYDELEELPATQVAWALEVRGASALRAGRPKEARRDLDRALAHYRAVEADELNLARVLSLAASCGFQSGELDDLEPMLSECLEILVRRFGEADPQTRSIREAVEHLHRELARADGQGHP